MLFSDNSFLPLKKSAFCADFSQPGGRFFVAWII